MTCWCRYMWIGPLISEDYHFEWRWLLLVKISWTLFYTLFYIRSYTSQFLLLIAPASAVSIRFWQVYLLEALVHLRSLHLSFLLVWNRFLVLWTFEVPYISRLWTCKVQMYLFVKLKRHCRRCLYRHQMSEPLFSCCSEHR